MGTEASNSVCSGSLREHLLHLSLMCTICIESPPRQLTRRIVDSLTPQQSILIFATITLGHPKSGLETFRGLDSLRGSSRCVLSSDSSSLAYWNLRWIVLKPYILPQRHKRLISSIQKTKLFLLLSAQRVGLR